MNKRQAYFIPLLTAAFALSACGDSNEPNLSQEAQGVELQFAPTVKEMENQPITRATNIFFADKDEILIDITDNKTDAKATSYTYAYNTTSGIFTGKNDKGFFFSLDNTYIKELTANWPSVSIEEEGVILDQRKQENFKRADRLQAVVNNYNIMPTSEPVPLNFEHKQSRFSFRIAGQNADDLKINELILELQYNDPKTEEATNVSGAFWAYCHDNIAELILLPGMEIKAPRKTTGSNEIDEDKLTNGRFMIGRVSVGGNKPYKGGIWLHKDTEVKLESGKDYVVTLTPEGYNLIASIEVHGFGQDEGHIGIPVNYPTLKSEDIYEVGSISQLVTLSHLLCGNITNQTGTADEWKARNYHVNQDMTITKDWKRVYKPIATSLRLQFKNTDGSSAIEAIKDEDGTTFNLFE